MGEEFLSMALGKRKNYKGTWLTCIGAIIVVALALLTSEQRLEVYRWETAAPLFTVPSGNGTEFSLWFLHSYDRAFFQEHYRVERGDRIVLTRMSFKSNLNGQGFEEGVYRTMPDGTAELYGINREIREIRFRLGSPDLANHTLIIGGRRIPLLSYAEAGEIIGIRSKVFPRWQSLLEEGTRIVLSLLKGDSPEHHRTTNKTDPAFQELTWQRSRTPASVF